MCKSCTCVRLCVCTHGMFDRVVHDDVISPCRQPGAQRDDITVAERSRTSPCQQVRKICWTEHWRANVFLRFISQLQIMLVMYECFCKHHMLTHVRVTYTSSTRHPHWLWVCRCQKSRWRLYPISFCTRCHGGRRTWYQLTPPYRSSGTEKDTDRRTDINVRFRQQKNQHNTPLIQVSL